MRRFPSALVLIFAMIVCAQIFSYALPAGEFEREMSEAPIELGEVTLPGGERVVLPPGTTAAKPGRKVIPGSYHRVEAPPLPWHASLTRIPEGLAASAEIIFFVFMVGGVIGVVKATGSIDALIGTAIARLGHRPSVLVTAMMALFALGSATIGMAEEYMPFVPILVSMCIALEMDAVVALAMVYVGAGLGYGWAALNPFTVLIAKDIAGQDTGVFFWERWVLLAICVAIGAHHTLRYAARVRADPSRSLVADVDYSHGSFAMPEGVELTGRRIAILVVFAAMIGLFVWGVNTSGWYLVELTALFLGVGLVATAIGRMSPNDAAKHFTEGAAEMTGTALLIGFARTIEVLLVEAKVIDTVISGIASGLSAAEGLGEGMSAVVGAWGMLAVQSICNFLVPSGSGQAYVTMPIMAPLADLVGVGRETAVLAYQFGDGFTNMIVPTNALLMGMLMLARIPYPQWLRFIVPLLVKIYVVALIVLAWAALTGLQ